MRLSRCTVTPRQPVKPEAAPGQVHPTARSLCSLHPNFRSPIPGFNPSVPSQCQNGKRGQSSLPQQAPGQVHPTARSLCSLHPNFRSPIPGFNPSVPSQCQNGKHRQRSLPATSPRPGSPHSKKPMLAPSEFPQPNPGLQPFRTVPVPKWDQAVSTNRGCLRARFLYPCDE
jgi:hypothetical protein